MQTPPQPACVQKMLPSKIPPARFSRSFVMSDATSHSRGSNLPGFCVSVVPPRKEGAGNAGCWPHPRALRAKEMHFCARKQPQGSRNNRHSLRNGVTAYTWSPRCSGLSGHRRLVLVTRSLIPASGDRDNTTSPSASSAFVFRTRYVHRIPPPTFVTIAKRPSSSERDGER